MIRIKRVYEAPDRTDGHRVLVDRLWPRGLSKESAHVDAWMKDLAPSDELRRWFGHDPERFAEFRRRYREELMEEPARTQLADLARRAAREKITLVFGAKDVEHNNAVVLSEELERRCRRARRAPSRNVGAGARSGSARSSSSRAPRSAAARSRSGAAARSRSARRRRRPR